MINNKKISYTSMAFQHAIKIGFLAIIPLFVSCGGDSGNDTKTADNMSFFSAARLSQVNNDETGSRLDDNAISGSTLLNSMVIGRGEGIYALKEGNDYTLVSNTVSIEYDPDSYFVYTPLAMDGEAIVQMTDIDGGPFTRGGLMIRDELNMDSPYAIVAMTQGKGTSMYWVESAGDEMAEFNEWNSWYATQPYWLRLVRAGNVITGYRSDDAVSWEEINSVTIELSGEVYIGLGFYGNNLGNNASVSFNDFSLTLHNHAPTITFAAAASALLIGESLDISALALDHEDGDISSNVQWSDGTNTGTGPSFEFTPAATGDYLISASVTDSLGDISVETFAVRVVSDLGLLDDDNDGLSTNEENALGTDPLVADSDGDGLLDGEEVMTYGSNPLSTDSDADGLDDAYEVAQGYDPAVADSDNDADGDGSSNLDEFLNGTDPHADYDYLGAPLPTLQNDIVLNTGSGSFIARGESYDLSSDTVSIEYDPDAYFVYTTLSMDGEAIVQMTDIDGGPFTRAGLMIRDELSLDSSYAVVAMTLGKGTGMYWVESTGGTDAQLNEFNSSYATQPYWLRLVRAGNLITGYRSEDAVTWEEISSVTVEFSGDVYIGLGFFGNNSGQDATVSFNDFSLALHNHAPVITFEGATSGLLLGETLDLTATALDSEDGDISSNVQWSDGTDTTSGSTFAFTPAAVGEYQISATVTDSFDVTTVETISVNVTLDPGLLDDDNDGLNTNEENAAGTDPNIADTDADGLLDGEEVNTYGSNPLSTDSDADGLEDGYEVEQGYDPAVADSDNDSDGDGSSNLDEFLNGTDPHADYDYLGAPLPTLQNDIVLSTGSGSFITRGEGYDLTSDTVSIEYDPDSYFVYTTLSMDGEAIVQMTDIDGGSFTRAGLMIRDELSLDSPYAIVAMTLGKGTGMYWVESTGGADAQLDEFNSWYATQPYWLRLVREGNLITGYRSEDAVEWDEISSVTVEFSGDVYIGLGFYGNNSGQDATVSFDSFALTLNNHAPAITFDGAASGLLLGESLNITALALDDEDGDISTNVQWSEGSNSETGASFEFVPAAVGDYLISASVTDSMGSITTETIAVNVTEDLGLLDDDEDGLSTNEENALGTDPNIADTDGDGLLDGEEVNIYGSNPLSTDSDEDGLEDAYEVEQGYDPAVADSDNDADGDGSSNLDEFLNGTDPQDPYDYLGAPLPTLQNDTVIGEGNGSNVARIENYTLTSDTVSIEYDPDSYFVYTILSMDGEAIVQMTDIDGGSFTRAGLMIRDDLSLDSSYAVVAMTLGKGTGMYWVESTGGADAQLNEFNSWYATQPYWLRLVREGNLITGYRSEDAVTWDEISSVTVEFSGDVYIGLGFYGNNSGQDATVSFDGFALTLNNHAPAITFDGAASNLLLGETLDITALALDDEDGDISSNVQWSEGSNSETGANFEFVPAAVGAYLISASVTDSMGSITTESIAVTVTEDLGLLDEDEDGLNANEESALGTDPNIADTDADGLLDGEEVNTYGSNPLSTDSDADGLEDGYEVDQGYDPAVADSDNDADGDGSSNLDEFLNGTDPQDPNDYLGAPLPTLQNEIVISDGTGSFVASGENYVLTSDTVSIEYDPDSYFVYTTLSTDGEAIVQMTDIDGGSFTRAGLMIRDELSMDSPYAVVAMTLGKGTGMYWVETPSGDASELNEWNGWYATQPYWLRLVRVGNLITGYRSEDAVEWDEISSVTVEFSGDVYIGLGFYGNNSGQDATVSFESFSLSTE